MRKRMPPPPPLLLQHCVVTAARQPQPPYCRVCTHRPALIQLHHYAWWHAVGDGVSDGGLFYHPAGEAQLGVFASVSWGVVSYGLEMRCCTLLIAFPLMPRM